ncbi:MAG: hypothetical protein MSG64_17545 [Pyrinomonadaceae bacterium MAG19_C2-C3]|nr:hypothetical protein [Pyrinomonadaceae bacterium MAG19_C2-C3]
MLLYDLEIINAIPPKDGLRHPDVTYASGWHDYLGMGIAVICCYDYKTDRTRVFSRDNLAEFPKLAATNRGSVTTMGAVAATPSASRPKAVNLSSDIYACRRDASLSGAPTANVPERSFAITRRVKARPATVRFVQPMRRTLTGKTLITAANIYRECDHD